MTNSSTDTRPLFSRERLAEQYAAQSDEQLMGNYRALVRRASGYPNSNMAVMLQLVKVEMVKRELV